MPQMAPMNWMLLFIYFFIVFMIFNLMNYFMMMKTQEMKTIKIKTFNKNWKW